MFTLGFSTFPDDDDKGEEERAALKMVRLLQEHGWSFNMSRDPVLILIAIEEDVDEDEEHRDHGDSGDIDEE